MKVTDFLVMDADGAEISADAHGNNVAFCCQHCGGPVLAIALANMRGSDEDHPAACRRCGIKYFLDVREKAMKVYIHSVGPRA
jgi:DNA-directed RNA polymerase subunit RPC12/RpoP